MNDIVLRPSYWANVSGGKDSLFMLKLILSNLDIYPLDGVIHFELEIDYPFIKNVVDYMQSECTNKGIKFLRIKPRRSWYELFDLYGFPTRLSRWCNSSYKLDSIRQLQEHMKNNNMYVVSYIGYCSNEIRRAEGLITKSNNYRFPLIDCKIDENDVLEWAKTQKIYNDYYVYNKRCGCMFCPMASRMELAYLLKYYPDKYNELIYWCKKGEEKFLYKYGRKCSAFGNNSKYDTEYIDNNVRTIWVPKLEKMHKDFC